MSELPKLIPFAKVRDIAWLDRKASASTVYKWYAVGRGGVKLRAVRGVGGLCTTEQWLHEFFQQSSSSYEALPTPTVTKARASTGSDRTASAMDSIGKIFG